MLMLTVVWLSCVVMAGVYGDLAYHLTLVCTPPWWMAIVGGPVSDGLAMAVPQLAKLAR